MRLRLTALLLVSTAWIALGCASYASAQSVPTLTEDWLLKPAPDSISSSAGSSLDASDHHILVGDIGSGPDTWLLYPYHEGPGTWTLDSPLSFPSGMTASGTTRFGETLDLSGHRLVTSSRHANVGGTEGAGAVFVYTYDDSGDGWTLEATLSPDDRAHEDRFGNAVALDGDRLLATDERFRAEEQPWRSAAYVYLRDDVGIWTEEARLIVETDSGDHSRFGFGGAATLAGDVAAVGAKSLDVDGHETAGGVYVFARTGEAASWALDTLLTDPAPLKNTYYGTGVALVDSVADGTPEGATLLVIGSDQDDVAGPNSGAVYVHRRDPATGEWLREVSFIPHDIRGFWRLGWRVDAAVRPDGTALVIAGALGAGPGGGQSPTGAAYVFARDPEGVWREVAKLVPSDPQPGSGFGVSVAITPGGMAVVGNIRRGQPTERKGAAYVYDLSGVLPVASEAFPESSRLALAITPNPVRQLARITYALASPGTVRLTVHDALGRQLAVLVDARQLEGAHTAAWSTDGLAAGVYLVRLATEDGVRTAPLTVVR